jgi:hypothetical protein
MFRDTKTPYHLAPLAAYITSSGKSASSRKEQARELNKQHISKDGSSGARRIYGKWQQHAVIAA